MTVIPLHFDTSLMAVICFAAAFFACSAGLFYSEYRENWPQHVGMVCVAIASAMKVFQIWERQRTSPETALLALGVALFAAGVAWKVWQHRRGWDGAERRSRDRRRVGQS